MKKCNTFSSVKIAFSALDSDISVTCCHKNKVLYKQIQKQFPGRFFIIVKAVADEDLPKHRLESLQVQR